MRFRLKLGKPPKPKPTPEQGKPAQRFPVPKFSVPKPSIPKLSIPKLPLFLGGALLLALALLLLRPFLSGQSTSPLQGSLRETLPPPPPVGSPSVTVVPVQPPEVAPRPSETPTPKPQGAEAPRRNPFGKPQREGEKAPGEPPSLPSRVSLPLPPPPSPLPPPPGDLKAPKPNPPLPRVSCRALLGGPTPVAVVVYEGKEYLLGLGDRLPGVGRLVGMEGETCRFKVDARILVVPMEGRPKWE